MAKRKKRRIDLNETWEIGLGRNSFKQLASQRQFQALMALCRAVNMLRYAQGSVLGFQLGTSPFARRQTLASMSIAFATTYEVYQNVLPAVATAFKASDHYLRSLGAWRGDAKVRQFVETYCRPLRSSSTFHFDVDAFGNRLTTTHFDWARVVSSRGSIGGLGYFDLADIIALQPLWGDVNSDEEFKSKLRKRTSDAAKVVKWLIREAEGFVGEFISREPFRLRQLEASEEPEWLEQLLLQEPEAKAFATVSRMSRRV